MLNKNLQRTELNTLQSLRAKQAHQVLSHPEELILKDTGQVTSGLGLTKILCQIQLNP